MRARQEALSAALDEMEFWLATGTAGSSTWNAAAALRGLAALSAPFDLLGLHKTHLTLPAALATSFACCWILQVWTQAAHLPCR